MSISLVGWWWASLLVIVIALPLIWRWYGQELQHAGLQRARALVALRSIIVILIALILAQPAVLREHRSEDPAIIEVIVDTSASMGASDPTLSASALFDEAEAAGVFRLEHRDTSARAVAQALQELEALGDELAQALQAEVNLPRALRPLLRRLETNRDAVAGVSELHEGLNELIAQLQAVSNARKSERPELLRDVLAHMDERIPVLLRQAETAQQRSDAASRNALDEEQLASLIDFAALSRSERLAAIWQQRLAAELDGVTLRMRRSDAEGSPLQAEQLGAALLPSLDLHSDVSGPLRRIARAPGDEHVTGTLVISDGRFGGGAEEVARVLGLRGIAVHGLAIGSSELPRDAAIASIDGAGEVQLGETVVLDVRFRISGYEDAPWLLQLTRNGETVDERPVVGSGDWQIERFEYSADSAGVDRLEARLSPLPDVQAAVTESEDHSGLTWEVWAGLRHQDTNSLHQLSVFNDGEASHRQRVEEAASPVSHADHFVSRLSGWVIPPVSGDYRFFIRADDGAQLWLSSDASFEQLQQIATNPSHVSVDDWTKRDQQQSAIITLRAGQPYAIQALHWEGSGGDHVGIGWQLPDGSLQRPIPGSHLRPRGAGLDSFADLPVSDDDERYPAQALRDNDQASAVVVVHEDPLRVLIVDHAPRWDARFLVSLLERDRRVEIDRRYRSVLLPQGVSELLPPSQEALDAYDLVVLGDLRGEELSAADHGHLRRFVYQRGGMLLLLAGPRGMPATYGLGELADLMPVRSIPGSSPIDQRSDGLRQQRYRLRLGAQADAHPIMAVLDDSELNRQLWPLLRPVTWIEERVQAKSGADVLLEVDAETATPVVVSANAGAGRVLYLGSDETWRWRDRIGDQIHQRFWLQALRWGLSGRLRGTDPLLQVGLDAALVSPGSAVELRVRSVRADGSAADGPPEALLSRPDESEQRIIELSPVADADALWSASISDLGLGEWQLRVTSPDAALQGLEEVRDLLVGHQGNLGSAELRADPSNLQRLAAAAGGISAPLALPQEVIDALREKAEPRQRSWMATWRLWDHYHVIILLTVLLTLEWLWRKRLGLP